MFEWFRDYNDTPQAPLLANRDPEAQKALDQGPLEDIFALEGRALFDWWQHCEHRNVKKLFAEHPAFLRGLIDAALMHTLSKENTFCALLMEVSMSVMQHGLDEIWMDHLHHKFDMPVE